MNKKILLLEDDSLLQETLEELLVSEGYDVTSLACANDVIDTAYDNKFDLYIFDINVPDMSGLELLESLREADDNTPAIFISAMIDLQSISKAFDIGAYDYMKKPFFPQELLIRVNAKLATTNTDIKYKNLLYSPKTKTLRKDNKLISLGEVQERLLNLFLNNIGQVLDKEILLESLEKPSSTALRVAITKLKQTTELDIKNVRSLGYILE